jgi:hypothetical protein
MRRRSQISLGVLPRSLLPPLFKIDANEKTGGGEGSRRHTVHHTAERDGGRAGGPKREERSYQQTRLTTSLPASL